MDIGILVLQLIGTASFAVSGAMTAMRKGMDVLGVTVLGLTTAVGGGILRDVLLGRTPPAIFSDPLTVAVAAASAILVFIPAVRRLLMKTPLFYERVMLLVDSVGLGLFTVIGAQTACAALSHANWFTIAFLGTITGVGGGVLRDVMAGNTPYIFVKHVYASASIIGAMVCVFLNRRFGELTAMLVGAAVVFVIRILAAHYKWNLPRIKPMEAE